MKDKASNPSPTGVNGRDTSGRFAAGNRAGKGNPLNKRVQKLRAEMVKAVTGDDIREIVFALIDRAKEGDVAAAREVLDRVVGRAVPIHLFAPAPLPIVPEPEIADFT